MQGSPVTVSKKKKGFLITPPAALQIFLILLVALVIAAVHVYKLGVKAMTDYETNQVKNMMVRSVGTGTEMIYLEGKRTAAEGRYLDLGAAMKKIDAIDFVSNGRQEEDGENGITVNLRKANLQFWYLVVRGNGRILLVDSTAGTSRELTEEEALYSKCHEAAESSGGVQWEDEGSYFSLFLQPLNGPVRYDGSPLLYNVAGAQIGMVVKGDLSFVEDSVRERVLLYVLLLCGFLLLFIIGVCVSVHRYLWVLRDIGRMMRRNRLEQFSIMEELKKRMSVIRKRSKDSEMKDLAESFYAMACNLQDYRDTVENIKSRYEPFAPEALLFLFHKENPLDVRPGDETEIAGALLHVDLAPYGPEEANTLCGAACEIISSKGGIAVHIAKAGIEAIFPASGSGAEETSKAERAAKEAAECIQDLEKEETDTCAITAKVQSGTFCLQVIGSERRMEIRLA